MYNGRVMMRSSLTPIYNHLINIFRYKNVLYINIFNYKYDFFINIFVYYIIKFYILKAKS